eukprot:scaffold6821_cov127-Cylindrotheca_fusiformis.AAC.7
MTYGDRGSAWRSSVIMEGIPQEYRRNEENRDIPNEFQNRTECGEEYTVGSRPADMQSCHNTVSLHRYDPMRAAWQMKNFFDTKHLLFCKDKLVKETTLDDLDNGDKRSFHRGSLQVLPVRDRAGRLITLNVFHSTHIDLPSKT